MDDIRSGATGQSRRSFAVGIASLLVGTKLLPPVAARSSSSPSTATGTRRVADEPAEVWWNEDFARLVNLEGSWSMESRADRIVFRPGGLSSRVDLLAMLTGRIHSHEFQERGEVVLAHGFVMIATDRPCSISQTPEVDGYSEAELMKQGEAWSNKSWFESLELHGTEPWSLELPPEPERHLRLVHAAVEGSPTNSVVVNMSSGEVKRYMPNPESPILVLTLTRTQELGHPNEITWIKMSPSPLK